MDSPRLLASTTGLHLLDTQKCLDVEAWNDNFATKVSAVTFETIHSNPDRARHLARSLGSATNTVIADPFKAKMKLVVHGLCLRYEVEMVQEDARAAVRFMRKMAKEARVQIKSLMLMRSRKS